MTEDIPDILLTIQTLGNLLDDLEHVRIQNGNRIGAIERTFGSSLPELDVAQEGMRALEHQTELQLKRAWRKHPLAPWAKTVPGLGEKTLARLIAEIGDPAERPNPGKLFAYCGHGDARRRIAKGMTQEELFKAGNPKAKKRLWIIANGFVKAVGDERQRRSPYRDIYEQARAKYADRVHERPCVRCGPSGHPAPAGSPWSDGHKHAAATRYVGKRFLLDLWKESVRLRGHREYDIQTTTAPLSQ